MTNKLTIKEASELTGLKTNSIYTYISLEKIPYHKDSRKHVYFFKEELERWMNDKLMANPNYLNILPWMTKMNLESDELLVFSAFFNLSRYKDALDSTAFDGLKKLTGLTKERILSALSSLEKRGHIIHYFDIFGKEKYVLLSNEIKNKEERNKAQRGAAANA